MEQSKNRPKVGSAVFKQHAIKWMAIVALWSLTSLLLVACADESTDHCAKDPADFPARLTGTLYLTVEGASIAVPVTIKTSPATEDECQLDMLTTQSFEGLCGSAFRGVLDYNVDDKAWEGEVVEYDETTGLYQENGTHMRVKYTERSEGFHAWNHMYQSPEYLCEDRVIEGDVSAAR